MKRKYTIQDWSVNPCLLKDLTLVDVVNECSALSDEQTATVALLSIGESFTDGEYSITCDSMDEGILHAC